MFNLMKTNNYKIQWTTNSAICMHNELSVRNKLFLIQPFSVVQIPREAPVWPRSHSPPYPSYRLSKKQQLMFSNTCK